MLALCAHFVIDSRRCCLRVKLDKSMGALAEVVALAVGEWKRFTRCGVHVHDAKGERAAVVTLKTDHGK